MTTTREKVLELRRRDPKMLANHIAIELGVSRERIRQLLKEAELATDLRPPAKVHHCKQCGSEILYNQWYEGNDCSPCQRARYNTTVPCAYCGTPVTRNTREIERSSQVNIFCSHEHSYRYMWLPGNRMTHHRI